VYLLPPPPFSPSLFSCILSLSQAQCRSTVSYLLSIIKSSFCCNKVACLLVFVPLERMWSWRVLRLVYLRIDAWEATEKVSYAPFYM
ncbi:hypothetical protein COCCADRAFT_93871, partial [Bipolaris zeicola 26-R-13]